MSEQSHKQPSDKQPSDIGEVPGTTRYPLRNRNGLSKNGADRNLQNTTSDIRKTNSERKREHEKNSKKSDVSVKKSQEEASKKSRGKKKDVPIPVTHRPARTLRDQPEKKKSWQATPETEDNTNVDKNEGSKEVKQTESGEEKVMVEKNEVSVNEEAPFQSSYMLISDNQNTPNDSKISVEAPEIVSRNESAQLVILTEDVLEMDIEHTQTSETSVIEQNAETVETHPTEIASETSPSLTKETPPTPRSTPVKSPKPQKHSGFKSKTSSLGGMKSLKLIDKHKANTSPQAQSVVDTSEITTDRNNASKTGRDGHSSVNSSPRNNNGTGLTSPSLATVPEEKTEEELAIYHLRMSEEKNIARMREENSKKRYMMFLPTAFKDPNLQESTVTNLYGRFKVFEVSMHFDKDGKRLGSGMMSVLADDCDRIKDWVPNRHWKAQKLIMLRKRDQKQFADFNISCILNFLPPEWTDDHLEKKLCGEFGASHFQMIYDVDGKRTRMAILQIPYPNAERLWHTLEKKMNGFFAPFQSKYPIKMLEID